MDPTQVLTWSMLLARCTEFARSAVAMPHEGEWGSFRRAVPAIIGLQAVTFALSEVPTLPEDERRVARDRAAVLIDRYEAEVRAIWEPGGGGDGLPGSVAEMVKDARAALLILETSLSRPA